ncbi:MAG: glutathione S-transferase, partial [Brevundimonas sp.]
MTVLQAAALWSGLLIIWVTVLGVRVTLDRRRHKVLLGDGGVAAMNVSVRVFANAAEYTPFGLAALILMALTGCPA